MGTKGNEGPSFPFVPIRSGARGEGAMQMIGGVERAREHGIDIETRMRGGLDEER
jgi:hypothetical protein